MSSRLNHGIKRSQRYCGGFVTALSVFAGVIALACASEDDTAVGDEASLGETEQSLYGIGRYWPKDPVDNLTKIPVCWDFDGYDEDKAYVRSAVEGNWAGISSIKFTRWDSCTDADTNAMVIRISNKHEVPSSSLGPNQDANTIGAKIFLNFFYDDFMPDCQDDRMFCDGVIGVHEFGHAIGFYHEHERPDNANGEYCSNYRGFQTDGAELITVYDTDSIMGYCSELERSDATISQLDIEGAARKYGVKPSHLTHQVVAYSDAYFQGKVQALYPGVYRAGDLTIGTSTLSSLRVPDGWQVAIYKDENCAANPSLWPVRDIVDLSQSSGGWDNVARCIRVYGPAQEGVIAFDGDNYTGTAQTLRPGVYPLAALTVGNDAISSLQIPQGWTVTLYDGDNFSGATKSYTANVSQLSSTGWDNRATSVRVRSPWGPVMVFADNNYSGQAQALWPGRYNLDDLTIGNDALSSLIVPTGWTVTLHEMRGFWGKFARYTTNQSSTGTYDNMTSSIVVEGPVSP